MKSILTLASLIFLSITSIIHADDGKHLFILSGQSNMERLNPALSFTPTVTKEFGEGAVIVIKDAMGGQPISRWYHQSKSAQGATENTATTQGDLYQRLMKKVKLAIAGQKLDSVTFVWMQGERDAKESLGDVYAECLKGLIKQIQKDLERDDMHVVIGRISDCGMKNKTAPPHWVMVREAEVKVADELPSAAWVDTDDLNGDKNDLHCTKPGFVELGKRFAEKAITLIKQQKK